MLKYHPPLYLPFSLGGKRLNNRVDGLGLTLRCYFKSVPVSILPLQNAFGRVDVQLCH